MHKADGTWVNASGKRVWYKLGLPAMSDAESGNLGWRKYRYGPNPAAWPITLQANNGKAPAAVRGRTKAKKTASFTYSERGESGIRGLCLALFWEAYRSFTEGTPTDKAEVLRWINGAPARVPFDTVCTILGLNKKQIQRIYTTKQVTK